MSNQSPSTDGQPAGPPAAPSRRQAFVDAGLLIVTETKADRRAERHRMMAPDATDAVTLLGESHDIVVIANEPVDDVAELASLPTLAGLPETFPHGSWYVTADSSWCEGDRRAGLRSLLVGPRRPPARRPTARCDHEARDLSAAVMEILVRESMA